MFKFNTSNKHTTNIQTDKDLKEEGNRLFSYKQYEKAIECYNKAIVSKINSLKFVVLINIDCIVTNYIFFPYR